MLRRQSLLFTALPLLFMVAGLPGCSDEEQVFSDKATIENSDTSVDANNFNSENRDSLWLRDRYGSESGRAEYLSVIATDTTREVRMWRDYGATEIVTRYLAGTEREQRMEIRDGMVIVQNPADSTPLIVPWTPDLPIAMPNFRNLTPEMRRQWEIADLPPREHLDRMGTGYRLERNGVRSDVWIWEGVLLYAELDALPEKGIDPVVVFATSIDTGVVADSL